MSDLSPGSEGAERFAITDDELEAMALAADPTAGLTPDAVPWTSPDDASPALLPEWYMPRPMTRTRASWPIAIAALVIVGFLVIDAFGLCITSGFLSWA
jgi:hypothetical protein